MEANNNKDGDHCDNHRGNDGGEGGSCLRQGRVRRRNSGNQQEGAMLPIFLIETLFQVLLV
jgi:hypothetical protein